MLRVLVTSEDSKISRSKVAMVLFTEEKINCQFLAFASSHSKEGRSPLIQKECSTAVLYSTTIPHALLLAVLW